MLRREFGKASLGVLASTALPNSTKGAEVEEAATKFRGCAEYADWPKVKAEKIIAFLKALDSAPDASTLSPLLSAERG